MRKFYILVLTALLALPAMAQISTGEPHYNVIPRTGNRPTANTWGMYLGVSANQIADMVKSSKVIKAMGKEVADSESAGYAYALPMINIKYYATDNWEVRLGFQFAANTATTTLKTYVEPKSKEVAVTTKTKEGNDYTRFLPGFAYHFNKSNIIDVYLGASMPIGWNSSTQNEESSSSELKQYHKQHTSKFAIGAGVVLGLQFFVADLPFAIGIETGFAGYLYTGGATKHEVLSGEKGEKKQTYYTYDDVPTRLSAANSTTANWGADAAITFTYFFK